MAVLLVAMCMSFSAMAPHVPLLQRLGRRTESKVVVSSSIPGSYVAVLLAPRNRTVRASRRTGEAAKETRAPALPIMLSTPTPFISFVFIISVPISTVVAEVCRGRIVSVTSHALPVDDTMAPGEGASGRKRIAARRPLHQVEVDKHPESEATLAHWRGHTFMDHHHRASNCKPDDLRDVRRIFCPRPKVEAVGVLHGGGEAVVFDVVQDAGTGHDTLGDAFIPRMRRDALEAQPDVEAEVVAFSKGDQLPRPDAEVKVAKREVPSSDGRIPVVPVREDHEEVRRWASGYRDVHRPHPKAGAEGPLHPVEADVGAVAAEPNHHCMGAQPFELSLHVAGGRSGGPGMIRAQCWVTWKGHGRSGERREVVEVEAGRLTLGDSSRPANNPRALPRPVPGALAFDALDRIPAINGQVIPTQAASAFTS
jgi:hypothetical protein